MNLLVEFAKTNQRIPLSYREKSLDQIINDVNDLLSKNIEIKNDHVRNLISLVTGVDKQVIKIEVGGKCHTMDLEIDDESHSYYANGIPTHNTVNIPHDYPYERFKNLYLDVYNTGFIKGFTTYRSGTMTSVLSAKDEKHADDSDEEIILDDVKLPDSLPAIMKRLRADGKKWYVTVIMNEEQTRPIAFFVHTNHHEKNVTTSNAVDVLIKLARDKGIPEKFINEIEEKIAGDNNSSKIARAISLNLRHGVMIKNVVRALEQVEDVFVGSFLFVMRKYLSTFIRDGEVAEGVKCDDCGGEVVFQEGCYKCQNCGSSKCG